MSFRNTKSRFLWQVIDLSPFHTSFYHTVIWPRPRSKSNGMYFFIQNFLIYLHNYVSFFWQVLPIAGSSLLKNHKLRFPLILPQLWNWPIITTWTWIFEENVSLSFFMKQSTGLTGYLNLKKTFECFNFCCYSNHSLSQKINSFSNFVVPLSGLH